MTDDFPEMELHAPQVQFTVDVTRHMLNPKMRASAPVEIIIPKGTVGSVSFSVHRPGLLETIIYFDQPVSGKDRWWVDSAWFVELNPVIVQWWVDLYVLFGDEVNGEYERVSQIVKTAHDFQAIDEVIATYEQARQLALSHSADLPSVITWVEIDVHEIWRKHA
jgi:hypothetical protein